ncbi:Ig-like domain-containing protein, partial [Candidatus Enterococcus ikei]
ISGQAESGATVTMYDKSDATVFLTGTAGTDGKYSLVVPEAKKPLVPYKTYYVTATDAAGNVSVASDSQVVADTTPPKAEAVKQELTLGDKLPSIDKMLANVSDNAGTAGLTIKQTRTPDVSKTGYKTADITLTDKAGNALVVVVPIIVKDALTAMDSKNLLKADDFSVLAIDLPETAAEQKAFILKHGAVEAWDLDKGQLINDKLIYSQGSLKKEPGEYSITVTIGNLSRVFKVKLLAGSLSFEKKVDNLAFGTRTIASKEQFVLSENKLSISVNDTRFKVNKWRLLAKVDHPLKTKDGLTSASSLVYRSYESGKVVDTKLTELNTPMYEPSKLNNGVIQVDFTKEKDKEVVLDVLPGSVRSGKEYSTQIIWTLENGP